MWDRPVAVGTGCSFFVANGRLMGCGAEFQPGMLGHGALDGEDRVVRTPTLLPSMVGILISSVSAGCDLNAAVSAAGTVYTWGVGGGRFLGHGDEGCSLVPKQVQALAGHLVLSVTT